MPPEFVGVKWVAAAKVPQYLGIRNLHIDIPGYLVSGIFQPLLHYSGKIKPRFHKLHREFLTFDSMLFADGDIQRNYKSISFGGHHTFDIKFSKLKYIADNISHKF